MAVNDSKDRFGGSFASSWIGGEDFVARLDLADGFGGAVGQGDGRVGGETVRRGCAGIFSATIIPGALPGDIVTEGASVLAAVSSDEGGVAAF